MKPAPLQYLRPSSVEDAVGTLAEYDGMARVLAGGQSLVPMLHMRLMRPLALVDAGALPDLDRIAPDGAGTRLGATVRYSTIERSPVISERLPLLKTMTRHVGDRQVRNRGTIGGSLSQADPTGEMPLACLVLDATVIAVSVRRTREISVDDLLDGAYATTLAPDEMIVEVRIPAGPHACAFHEVTRRHNDFAVLAVAVSGDRQADGTWRRLRIGLAGASDRALLAREAAALLEGTSLESEAIAAAADACLEAIDPPSDVRASAEYRRHLVAVHVRRILARLRDENGSARV